MLSVGLGGRGLGIAYIHRICRMGNFRLTEGVTLYRSSDVTEREYSGCWVHGCANYEERTKVRKKPKETLFTVGEEGQRGMLLTSHGRSQAWN